MNTLNKKITRCFFLTEDGYTHLVERWKSYANDKEKRHNLTAPQHLLYSVLRGKDWRKAFTAITNENKLTNGLTPFSSRDHALFVATNYASRFDIFEGLLVADITPLLKEFLKVNPDFSAYNAAVVAA